MNNSTGYLKYLQDTYGPSELLVINILAAQITGHKPVTEDELKETEEALDGTLQDTTAFQWLVDNGYLPKPKEPHEEAPMFPEDDYDWEPEDFTAESIGLDDGDPIYLHDGVYIDPLFY